jgi:hypothetical protein
LGAFFKHTARRDLSGFGIQTAAGCSFGGTTPTFLQILLQNIEWNNLDKEEI